MTCEQIQHRYELQLLGTLDVKERDVLQAALRAHLARGCPACEAAMSQARELAAHLAGAAAPAEPPTSLRERILAAAAMQVWKQWTGPAVSPPLLSVRAGDGDWESTGVHGVAVRRLFVDEAHDRVTMLVRMAAGSSYPRHRHAGPEECYVIEGDLRVGDAVLRAGDYQRADVESVHGVQSTDNGCLLFIVSSLRDQLEVG